MIGSRCGSAFVPSCPRPQSSRFGVRMAGIGPRDDAVLARAVFACPAFRSWVERDRPDPRRDRSATPRKCCRLPRLDAQPVPGDPRSFPVNASGHPLSYADSDAFRAYFQPLLDKLDAAGVRLAAFELDNELRRRWSYRGVGVTDRRSCRLRYQARTDVSVSGVDSGRLREGRGVQLATSTRSNRRPPQPECSACGRPPNPNLTLLPPPRW
jgi:hypothetical protein